MEKQVDLKRIVMEVFGVVIIHVKCVPKQIQVEVKILPEKCL